MRQFFGMSKQGNLKEAARGLEKPQLIMLLSNSGQFREHVQELESLYPGVPSIGCIGMGYHEQVVEQGVVLIAFYDGVTASAGVLEEVSVMPVRYIERLEQDLEKVGAAGHNTVCIDFCTGNDACVLTTFHAALRHRNVSLVGGTGDGGTVSANGHIYEDAAAYALVRNQGGRVRAYKENIYRPMGNYRFIASHTDKSKYILGALNGKSARQVYQDILHVTEQQILTQTFQNPFGKLNGDETCIISIKEVQGNSLVCFRQVNDSDVLLLLELGNVQETVQETVRKIRADILRPSAVFSVNCLFRYKLFTERGYMQQYLREMGALGNHAGLIGYGEHFNEQFVNQSMSCVVFE